MVVLVLYYSVALPYSGLIFPSTHPATKALRGNLCPDQHFMGLKIKLKKKKSKRNRCVSVIAKMDVDKYKIHLNLKTSSLLRL